MYSVPWCVYQLLAGRKLPVHARASSHLTLQKVEQGWHIVVTALASHRCVLGSIPRPSVICGLSLLVLFLVPRGSSLGTSVFPCPQNLTFANSNFDLDYCQALYREPLARVIAQALPVFDIKFALYICMTGLN